jgi:hypothetical protein
MRLPAHRLGTICAVLVVAAPLFGPADAQPAKPLSPALTVTDYCNAWSVTDRAARERLLARVWAPDGAYSDADTPLSKGVSGLSDVIAEFQRHYPGTHFRCSAPQQHHSFMRVTWILLKPDGSPVTHGVDIYDMAPDGQIRRIVGFFGDPPAIKP